ncbi:MAG: hypothetical protein KDB61_13440, partial [Planctomycetes bacterium]|nr:hypothetical protein [Planctomycetota bacterium]
MRVLFTLLLMVVGFPADRASASRFQEAGATEQQVPTRTQLRCEFEGADKQTPKQLQAALEFELETWMDGAAIAVVADDCAYQLTQHYRGLGFAQASVFCQPARDDRGEYLAFRIQEGKRSVVVEFY